MTEDQISDALKNIVPNRQGGTDWMAGTRTKRNRTRALTAGVAVVALAAVGVPLALSLQGRDAGPIVASPQTSVPTQSQAPSPTDTPSSPPASPTASPTTSPSGPVAASKGCDLAGTATPLTDGAIPHGASRAWLCTAPGGLGDASPTFGPAEPLTLDVDRIADAFAALAPAKEEACTKDYGETYAVVVEYPDRGPVVVHGQRYGCHTVSDGVVKKADADGYLASLIGLWEAQRKQAGPPSTPVPVTGELCLGARSMMTVKPGEGLSGIVCGVKPSADNPLSDRVSGPLSPEAVQVFTKALQESIDADLTSANPVVLSSGAPTVVLFNAFGDPVTMFAAEVDAQAGYAWFDGDKLRGWAPTIQAREQVEAAAKQVGARPDPIGGWSPCIDPQVDPNHLLTGDKLAEARVCVLADGRVTQQAKLDVKLVKTELQRAQADGKDVAPVPKLGDAYLAVRYGDGTVNRYYLTQDGQFAGVGADGTALVWQPAKAITDAIAQARKG